MKLSRWSVAALVAAAAWMIVPVQSLVAQQPGRRPPAAEQEEQPSEGEGFSEEPGEAEAPPARPGRQAGAGAPTEGGAGAQPAGFQSSPSGQPDEQAPEENLYDPPFARYVDMEMLLQAWHNLDAALLTDAALQVCEGERILYRPHKAISGDALLILAVRVASERHDQATLERLARIADGTGNEQLHALVASAGKLAGQSRGDDENLMLSVDDTSTEQLTLIKKALHGMRVASILGDAEHFARLTSELDKPEGEYAVLTEFQKASLKKIMGLRRDSLVADASTTAALGKLAGGTRGGDDAANIVGSVFRGVGAILGGPNQDVYVGGQNGYYYQPARRSIGLPFDPRTDDDHDHAHDHDHDDDGFNAAGTGFDPGRGRNGGGGGGFVDTRPRQQPLTLSRLMGAWYFTSTARDGSPVLDQYVLYRNGTYDKFRFEQDPRTGDWDLDHPIASLADNTRISQRKWTSDGRFLTLSEGQRFAEGPYRMSYSASGSTGYAYLTLSANGRAPRKLYRGPGGGP